MTLVEFLLARIAEDEARAYEVHNTHDCDSVNPPGFPCDCGVPERIASECEAKRRIVAIHQQGVTQHADPAQWCLGCGGEYGDTPSPCPTLAALALPYANHPDYDQEWKP